MTNFGSTDSLLFTWFERLNSALNSTGIPLPVPEISEQSPSLVQLTILERMKVTRIAIAHRLSTIRNAARIYVLEVGRVVQQGRFEELAHQDGILAKLMTIFLLIILTNRV